MKDLIRRVPIQPKPALLVIGQLPPPIHGVTTMNEAVIGSAGLRRRFAVHVVPLRFARSGADVGRFSPRKVLQLIVTGVRLARTCARRRPDLAYFTLVPSGAAFYRDLLFVAILRAFAVPTVFHLHGTGVREASRIRLNRALYRWAFRGAIVIQLSPRLYTDVEDYVPRSRCRFVPNGIPDLAADLGGAAARHKDRPPRILFLSNLRLAKGPLILLEALALLKDRGVTFRADFVGERSEEECARRVLAMTRARGLADWVTCRGPLYGHDKALALADADLLVLPSFREGFPLVLLEAMSLSLPVIATAVGGIPDMVEDGQTGYLVGPGDVQTLVERLESLLLNPALRQEMGRKGRQRYLELYTHERFDEALCGLFERELVNGVAV